VVKSVLTGVGRGEGLSDIQKRIDDLPRDLISLYRHMLDHIPEEYWKQSSRIFSVVHAALEPPLALTMWYAGERGYNPVEEIDTPTKAARCYQVYLRLMSQCAGLLEIRHHPHKDWQSSAHQGVEDGDYDCLQARTRWQFSGGRNYSYSRVHYLHRTTREFLTSPEIAMLLINRLDASTFDTYGWLAMHEVVEFRSSAPLIRRLGSAQNFHLSEPAKKLQEYTARCGNGLVRAQISSLKEAIIPVVEGSYESVEVDSSFKEKIQ